jgi:hypothetical protein
MFLSSATATSLAGKMELYALKFNFYANPAGAEVGFSSQKEDAQQGVSPHRFTIFKRAGRKTADTVLFEPFAGFTETGTLFLAGDDVVLSAVNSDHERKNPFFTSLHDQERLYQN